MTAPSGDHPPLKEKGGGMDKTYYHAEGEKYGWLKTNEAVIARERSAYEKLSGMQILVPEMKFGDTAPAQLVSKSGDTVTTGTGYYTQNVDIKVQFKPLMQALAVMRPVTTALKNMDEPQLAAFAEDVRKIRAKLEELSKVVGELTIAVDRSSGHAYLLDISPGEGGQGFEVQLDKVGNGLQKVLQAADAELTLKASVRQ